MATLSSATVRSGTWGLYHCQIRSTCFDNLLTQPVVGFQYVCWLEDLQSCTFHRMHAGPQ